MFTEGLKMAAVAVVSAVLTATVVIGLGRAVMEPSAANDPHLLRASTR